MLQHKDSYDVVIVGGGLVGGACAYFLASEGIAFGGSIAVIERDPSYRKSPSARAAGGIRQQFSTPENILMSLYGAEFVHHVNDHLALDGEDLGLVFHERGYLLLATLETLPLMQRNHAIQQQCGGAIRFLDAAELAARYPLLRSAQTAGGFLGERNEGWTDPYRLLQAFKRKAKALGVDYIEATAAQVQRVGRRATGVELNDQRVITAGAVINAAGASGARAIAASAGVELPIESRLRTTYLFRAQFGDLSAYPLVVLPCGMVFRSEGSGFLCNYAPPPALDGETFDFVEPDPDYFEHTIWPILADAITVFDRIKLTQSYSCHYDFNTLDENLIIGLPPELDNFYLACGFSGHGMQQSPAVGRALAELISYGEYRSIDLQRFGYQRVLDDQPIRETNCW